LIGGLTFLVAACWPVRRGWGWSWSWMWDWNLSRHRSLRKPVVATFFLAFIGLATGAGDSPAGPGSESAASAVALGRTAYAQGRWDQALVAFETAINRAPASAVPRYNAGATLFQLRRYDLAREHYREARERAGSSLRIKIDFALGNTALAEGDIAGAIRCYDDCVASTARGAALDTVRRDAAINRRFALEQQQALAAPHDDSRSDEPKSPNSQRRNRPDRQGKGDDPSQEGQSESDAGSGGSREGEGDRDPQPARRKRRGGAGGGQSVPPGARGDSPDDRLDAALENIRAAQNRRLPDDEPPASANDDRKDW
jgi:Ca-activated chloride channel family protein